MFRDIDKLDSENFDILIVGGGIHGASLAYYASLSGQKVALIEQHDFCSGTSSAMQRIIHGGLRYLQSADIQRVRESVKARKRYLQMFPQFVKPLQCIVPTTNTISKGRLALNLASFAYNFLSMDKNLGVANKNKIRQSGIITIEKYLSMMPNDLNINDKENYIKDNNINGGAKWYDAYCYSPERVVIELLKAASRKGALVANYIQAKQFLDKASRNTKHHQVNAFDTIADKDISIRSKLVINASGSNSWCCTQNNQLECSKIYGMNLIIDSIFDANHAMGFYGKDQHDKDVMYFTVSKHFDINMEDIDSSNTEIEKLYQQSSYTIVGTYWTEQNILDDLQKRQQACSEFIKLINESIPMTNKLSEKQLKKLLVGFVPALENTQSDIFKTADKVKIYAKKQHNISDFYDFYGVKFTTALTESEKFLKSIGVKAKSNCHDLKQDLSKLDDELFEQLSRMLPKQFSLHVLRCWINNYGSEVNSLVDIFVKDYDADVSQYLHAELDYVCKYEMALKADDAILRRLAIDKLLWENEGFLRFLQNYQSKHQHLYDNQQFAEKWNLSVQRIINDNNSNSH